jgi:hypothetical protein
LKRRTKHWNVSGWGKNKIELSQCASSRCRSEKTVCDERGLSELFAHDAECLFLLSLLPTANHEKGRALLGRAFSLLYCALFGGELVTLMRPCGPHHAAGDERLNEQEIMIANIYTFIHILLNVIAIGLGATVVLDLFHGELSGKWSIRFLEASLVASVTGFSVHRLLPSEEASMVAVYVAGFAILAWRKWHLTGVWSSVFAATATMVLYLNLLAAMSDASRYLLPLVAAGAAHSVNAFVVTQFLVTAFFVVLGIVAVAKFHPQPVHSFASVKLQKPFPVLETVRSERSHARD